MRFLADENVSRLVVERFRAAGFDVASVRETRPGASDKASWMRQLAMTASSSQRIATLANWSFAKG
jgi:Domain of unknown function (DUF5615)